MLIRESRQLGYPTANVAAMRVEFPTLEQRVGQAFFKEASNLPTQNQNRSPSSNLIIGPSLKLSRLSPRSP